VMLHTSDLRLKICDTAYKDYKALLKVFDYAYMPTSIGTTSSG